MSERIAQGRPCRQDRSLTPRKRGIRSTLLCAVPVLTVRAPSSPPQNPPRIRNSYATTGSAIRVASPFFASLFSSRYNALRPSSTRAGNGALWFAGNSRTIVNHLQKQVIENKQLVLTDSVQNYLGPDLVLRRCSLVLRTNARALTITNAQFLDCQIEAKKRLANFQMWCGAVIKGCTFKGRFAGNDFGHWPAQHPNGSIENCDFSDAKLDGCRFMDCNIGSIKLPKWPYFTILHPHNERREVESVEWPGKLRFWAMDLPSQPNVTSGLVEYAPTLAKKFGCTETELQNALTRLSNVLM